MIPDSPELVTTVHIPAMSASLRCDGLLQLEVNAGAYVTLQMIKDAVIALGKASDGKRYPLLIIAGKEATVGTTAMEYMSKENSDPYSIAEAYLISSISQRLLGNFYLSFNKPPKPTRIFTKKEEAIAWLNGFKANP